MRCVVRRLVLDTTEFLLRKAVERLVLDTAESLEARKMVNLRVARLYQGVVAHMLGMVLRHDP